MEDALTEMVKSLAGPAFLVMLGVVVVLLRAIWRKDRLIADTNDKLLRLAQNQFEFMRGLLGGKRYRKVESDEPKENR